MAGMKKRILLVEDEDKLRRVLTLQLESSGYEVEATGSAEDALKLVDRCQLILTDLRLPAMDGLALLEAIQRQNLRTPVVVMTAFGTVEIAVEAMKKGAVDFLPKPFSLDHLMAVVRKALEVQSLREENVRLKEELGHRYRFDNIVGSGAKMQELLGAVTRVAPTRATVLLCGESGVGKDLIARAIHHHSPRAAQPFVKINCTALPENLMESELFGYEKGAFTGATTTKPGKFEQADGGTVFLDEIGDVPPGIQVKLLRILQEREFERLGSNKTRQIDVRVIAATNVDLRRALEEGNFREDLYYRLNVFPLTIPSLRDRSEDIPLLAEHFLRKCAKELGSPVNGLSEAAQRKLVAYHWPGNVRELENVMERSLLYASGTLLQPEDIRLDHAPKRLVPGNGNGQAPSTNGGGNGGSEFLPEGVSLDEHEQNLIREALRRAGGNKSQAARMLGLTRNALRYRLSQMGLE
jgi:DNA-binding NtrC family response regulator